MKLYTPILLATLIASTPALAINEGVRDCNDCASNCGLSKNNGKLITYNPENGRTLSANLKGYVEEAQSIGAPAMSCIRTQGCQNELLRCYERLGCHGRAARKSMHTDGMACDWSSGYRGKLNRIIHKHHDITAWHHGDEGGAIHDYTGSYKKATGELVAPRGSAAPNVAEEAPKKNQKPAKADPTPVEQKVAKPAPVEQQVEKPAKEKPVRQPAAGPYQQMASGKYKCPRNLRSICGSTRDTRWCENWVKRGNTPGCHN